jgi:hypothetical protein
MRFWSVSTTVRNPERIRSFLKVLKELEGEVWNTKTQERYQILLLQRKVVGFGNPQFEKNLSRKHLSWLNAEDFTYKQAEEISKFKKYVGGLEMRGRQSLNPIEKMGLAYLDTNKKITITSFGNSFLEENYDLGDFFFRSFLKWQYPNPDLNKYSSKEGYNIKPLIATFHLLDKVNSLCQEKGIKAKGVSKTEFAMFFTTLSNYKNIDATAEKLIDFRNVYDSKASKAEKDAYALQYFNEHFIEYESWKNANEYADNVIRYFRPTRFIYLRGNENYIDLEPRRKIEINALLNSDNASAKEFTSKEEYTAYLGDASQPVLPWETKEKMQEVIKLLLKDIEETERNLIQKNIKLPKKSKINVDSNNIRTLNKTIDNLRAYRRNLSDASIHAALQLYENIEKCINELKNIHSLADKKPVELERIITSGLHALNDALEIHPNYPVGDDNEPVFTAPANKPDIECYYKTFNSICEVTLLTNRSQWFNEGQPVMRHFRDFELLHEEKQSYCLFVAPKIHRDTVNTFWFSVKYEYEGQKQKIVPITIQQFIDILQYLLEAKKQNQNYFLSHVKIQRLFEDIVSITDNVSKSDDWLGLIPKVISKWGKTIAA